MVCAACIFSTETIAKGPPAGLPSAASAGLGNAPGLAGTAGDGGGGPPAGFPGGGHTGGTFPGGGATNGNFPGGTGVGSGGSNDGVGVGLVGGQNTVGLRFGISLGGPNTTPTPNTGGAERGIVRANDVAGSDGVAGRAHWEAASCLNVGGPQAANTGGILKGLDRANDVACTRGEEGRTQAASHSH